MSVCVASIRYGAVFLVIPYFVVVQWTRGVYISGDKAFLAIKVIV